MVGEIRDRETAEIAVQASLTGHLVLSTVHTNDAPGAITRMRDMGVEPFLLASTLRAVIAQRLVRRLCPACRGEKTIEPALAELLGIEPGTKVAAPKGCAKCGESGYQGRIGVFEAVRIDDAVRRMIHDNADEATIARHAFTNAPSLLQSARALVLAGETSPEEAARVTRASEVAVEA
jgi:general secretion pathway protein E